MHDKPMRHALPLPARVPAVAAPARMAAMGTEASPCMKGFGSLEYRQSSVFCRVA